MALSPIGSGVALAVAEGCIVGSGVAVCSKVVLVEVLVTAASGDGEVWLHPVSTTAVRRKRNRLLEIIWPHILNSESVPSRVGLCGKARWNARSQTVPEH